MPEMLLLGAWRDWVGGWMGDHSTIHVRFANVPFFTPQATFLFFSSLLSTAGPSFLSTEAGYLPTTLDTFSNPSPRPSMSFAHRSPRRKANEAFQARAVCLPTSSCWFLFRKSSQGNSRRLTPFSSHMTGMGRGHFIYSCHSFFSGGLHLLHFI
jgi:hypothetical protein